VHYDKNDKNLTNLTVFLGLCCLKVSQNVSVKCHSVISNLAGSTLASSVLCLTLNSRLAKKRCLINVAIYAWPVCLPHCHVPLQCRLYLPRPLLMTFCDLSILFKRLFTWSMFAAHKNKYECTMDRELADAAAYAPDRCCVCAHQTAALFCVNWRRDRHLERPSIDAYLFEEHSCRFHSDSIWNDRALGFLTRSRPKQEQEQEQKEQQQDERYEISSWTEYVW